MFELLCIFSRFDWILQCHRHGLMDGIAMSVSRMHSRIMWTSDKRWRCARCRRAWCAQDGSEEADFSLRREPSYMSVCHCWHADWHIWLPLLCEIHYDSFTTVFFCTCIVYCILLLVAIVNFYLRRIYDIWYDMHWWQRRGRIWSQDSPAIVDKPRDACQDYCVNSAVLKHWYSMVSSFEIAYWELAIWSRRRDEGGGWCVTETSAFWKLGMNPAPKQRASLILR